MRQIMGFPGGSDSTDSACSVGDPGSIPGLGTHSSILFFFFFFTHQYSFLKNSMDRGAWQATVYGVTNSWTRLSN